MLGTFGPDSMIRDWVLTTLTMKAFFHATSPASFNDENLSHFVAQEDSWRSAR